MSAVLIGGSRSLGRLNPELTRRLENIIQRRLHVLIGDANGFDRAAQEYLAEREYGSVLVYCTAGKCRNNVGGWTVHSVEYTGRGHGRAFYTAKDDAMLGNADYGLFAWDAKSEGTLRNVRKMAEQGKPSAVYVSPIRQFVTIRSIDDMPALSENMMVGKSTSGELFSESRALPDPNSHPHPAVFEPF